MYKSMQKNMIGTDGKLLDSDQINHMNLLEQSNGTELKIYSH